MSTARHSLEPQSDGTVAGVSSWNWANTLHNVRARRERTTSRTLRTAAEVRRWVKRFPDVSAHSVERAIAALKTSTP